ncbi:MAG: acyl carrier protein [Gammaproteobacteria bacterium]
MDEQVRRIVADVLAIDEGQVTEDLGPSSAGNWDSMNHLRIVAAIEEEFGISFTMEEVQAIGTVKALEKLVADKRRNA